MIRRVFSSLLALLLCVSALPMLSAEAAGKTLSVSFSVETYQNRARNALKQINALRKKNNVPELVMSADLEKIAIQRAGEIFVFFDHDRPNLKGYETCLQDYKSLANTLAVEELISTGISKGEDAVEAWEEEYENTLLDSDYTHIGIACLYIKGSYNEYYWVAYLAQEPDSFKGKESDGNSKAGDEKNITVEIAKGMYERADNSHKSFYLKADTLSLKTRTSGKPTVYLYDKYDVEIGKCDLSTLTFKSSDTKVFTVDEAGTVTKKKNGTATLKITATGLDPIQIDVVINSSSGSSGSSGSSVASSASSVSAVKGITPELSLKKASKYVTLSASLKKADGFVLYRSNTKTGDYKKVDDFSGSSFSEKVVFSEMERSSYWYKIRAYVTVNGKRTYSEYSDPVQVKK